MEKRTQRYLKIATISVICLLLLGYFTVAIVMYFLQSRFIYMPHKPSNARTVVPLPSSEGFQTFEEHFVETEDKLKLHSYWIPFQTIPNSVNYEKYSGAKNSKSVFNILMLHGQSKNLATLLKLSKKLMSNFKCNIFLIDYRGYGKSDNAKPSETGIQKDSQAALNFFIDKIDKSLPVVVYGQSLGSAIAIDLVNRNIEKVQYLICDNGFTSISDTVSYNHPFFIPFKYVITENWNSLERIKNISKSSKCPSILFLVSEKDKIIPPTHSKKLYEAAKTNKDSKIVLKSFSEADHMNASDQPDFIPSLLKFLDIVE